MGSVRAGEVGQGRWGRSGQVRLVRAGEVGQGRWGRSGQVRSVRAGGVGQGQGAGAVSESNGVGQGLSGGWNWLQPNTDSC